jgi:hypothetical protein
MFKRQNKVNKVTPSFPNNNDNNNTVIINGKPAAMKVGEDGTEKYTDQVDDVEKNDTANEKKLTRAKELELIGRNTAANANAALLLKNKQYRKEAYYVLMNDKEELAIGSGLCLTTWTSYLAGWFVGLLAGILTTMYLWELLAPLCANNCNAPHGYCSEYGRCICISATHSGQFCEYSICDDMCSTANGICSPIMRKELLLPDCQWQNPTRDNNFANSITGWQNPNCQSQIAALQVRLFDYGEVLTDAEMSSIPSCLCLNGYSGFSCLETACPQSVNLLRCSGNGNTSVSLFSNDTVNGDGCFCRHTFQLLDYAAQLSPETVTYIQTVYPSLLFELFCGQIIISENAFFVKTISYEYAQRIGNFTDLSLACACQEFFEEPICGLGRCPINEFGDICSNNGAPNLGIGLEFNTSIRKHANCIPHCAQSNQTWCGPLAVAGQGCHWRCDVHDSCPPDLPIRCRGGTCVAANAPQQHNGEQGYFTHVGSAHRATSKN